MIFTYEKVVSPQRNVDIQQTAQPVIGRSVSFLRQNSSSSGGCGCGCGGGGGGGGGGVWWWWQ